MATRDFNPLDIFLQLEADFFRSAEGALRNLQFQPAVDMYESHKTLIVKMELAGINPEKINVTLSPDDRLLIVSGERNESQEEKQDRTRCYHLEIFYGTFEREIALPGGLRFDRNAINANYRDGFLVITLTKRCENPVETHTIPINRD